LYEAAEIDGASQPAILFNVIIPLIIPTIAAFIVFSAVGYWNEWFNCMIYIQKRPMWTLQYQLRDILVNAQIQDAEREKLMADPKAAIHPDNLKMSALMLTILPIIVVYPFVQKYFMSGVLVGAVKG
jgi:putative aldouronate transport system permease protein